MARVERVYNVPLRKEWLKVPKYQRAAKAIRALRSFVLRHMKTEEAVIGPFVNQEVWSHGIRNPPHHVKINAVKEDDGTVVIELFGKPLPKTKEEKPVEKGAVKKAVEALTGLKIKGKKPEQKAAQGEKMDGASATPASLKPETPTTAEPPKQEPEGTKQETEATKPEPSAPVKKVKKEKIVRK